MAKTRKLFLRDIELAKKIKKTRIEKEITQQELSSKLGVHPTYIGFIERGQKGLSLPVLYKIADALRVKVRDLFTF